MKIFPDCLMMVEATGPNELIMGIRHRQYPCLASVSPESILTPQGNQLIINFLNYNHEILLQQLIERENLTVKANVDKPSI